MKEHISTGLKSVRRAPFQALAAVTVLAVTFFVTTLLALLVYSSHQVLTYFETRPQVIVFLKSEASSEETEVLLQKLKSDSRVQSVNFVDQEDALNIYKEATADNPLLGELVSPSIFPASIEFSVSDLTITEDIIAEIENEQVVESVSFTANIGSRSSLGEVINRLKNITYYVRVGGLVSVLVLSITSFLVLLVVMGMRTTMRRAEIESLSLIGASGSFIRMPIIFEATAYAVVGVISGWLVASVALMYATPSILSYFGQIPVIPGNSLDFFMLLGAILGGEILIGLLIAFLGSNIAVSRSLRVAR